jgi:hypothetical protein
MANNYIQGASLVPASSLAPGGAQAACDILQHIHDEYVKEGELEGELEYCEPSSLELAATDKGDLYIASGDEYFCLDSFMYVVKKLAEQQLILESFGIEVAHYCSKLRPFEFGGSYFRAMPDGSVITVLTDVIYDLPDDKLLALGESNFIYKYD